jgi:hypothetical protein
MAREKCRASQKRTSKGAIKYFSRFHGGIVKRKLIFKSDDEKS